MYGLRPGIQQSKTFMWTRPAYLNVAAHQAIWNDFIYNKQDNMRSSTQIKSIYQKSLPKERITQYFLFGCKHELIVKGDTAVCAQERDVRAEWLGINNSNFSGRMTVSPEQRQTGFSITFNKDLDFLTSIPFFADTWFSVELPIFAIRNSLNLEQCDIHEPAQTTPIDIIAAFQQRCWRYSKIVNERTAFNPSGLIGRFGRAFLAQDHYQVVYNSMFVIPFGDGQNPEYLFDAYNGTNQHFGFGNSIHFQIPLNDDVSRYAFCWFLSLDHLFLFRNKQLRTFDLKNKPWSRYMLYNRQGGVPNQNIPGVNILTLKTRVRPYNFVNFSTGWRFKTEKCDAEIGYSLWGHGDERVKILCDFEEVYGIAGTGASAAGTATTASKSTIANQAPNDMTLISNCLTCEEEDTFVPVTIDDIDLSSAEAQSSINHLLHVSLGYVKKGETIDGFFGIGGHFEFPQKNTALHTWAVWFKVGASL